MNETPQVPQENGGAQSLRKKPFVAQAIYLEYLAVICLGLSQVLPVFGSDFTYYCIALLCLTFVFSSLGVRRRLLNYNVTKKAANWQSVPIMVIGVILCMYLAFRQFSLLPHVTIYVSSSSFPDANLPLTNRQFLVREDLSRVLRPHNVTIPLRNSKLVCVPIAKDEGEVGIRLALVNTSRVLLEEVHAVVNVDTNLPCVWGDGWNQGVRVSKAFANMYSAAFRSGTSVFPGDSIQLPEIRTSPFVNPMSMAVMVKAKDLPLTTVAFLVYCPKIPGITRPQIVNVVDSPVGSNHFRINLPLDEVVSTNLSLPHQSLHGNQ